MEPRILAPYAAVLALGYIVLTVRVIRARHAAKVALGTGDSQPLQRAVRAHANFIEYVPLALILIAFVEMGGGPAWLVHLLAQALLLGRAVHAYGITREREDFRFRVAGMMLTFAALAGASLTLLVRTVL